MPRFCFTFLGLASLPVARGSGEALRRVESYNFSMAVFVSPERFVHQSKTDAS
jgi:hypothetical protein